MRDQHKRNYGQNRDGSNTFTGRDPHGRSTNQSFFQTFRDPDTRSRSSNSNSKGQSNFGNAPLGINTHTKSDESSKAKMARPSDRTTEKSYGDAIRIRFLQNENNELKECVAKADDREEELKEEIRNLQAQIERAENGQRKLINLIDQNPCFLSDGSWTLEIGGMTFKSLKKSNEKDES